VLRTEVDEHLTRLRELEAEAAELTDLDADDLPEFAPPTAEVDGDDGEGGGLPALIDSRWSFTEQTRRLIASKRYRTEAA
jgi:hypothetical protein